MRKKVIIIGAGISGLSAAKYLSPDKYEVLILEARERVGGRIFTLHSKAGEVIEMGANWLHNYNVDHPLYSYVEKLTKKELCLELYIHDFFSLKGIYKIISKDPLILFKNILSLPNAVYQYFCRKKIDIKDFAVICFKKEKPCTLKNLLSRFSWGYRPADFNHNPYTNNGSKFAPSHIKYELNNTTEDEYFLSSGFDQILNNLLTSNQILGAKVTKFQDLDAKVQVTYERDDISIEIVADYVICTLPLGVLKHNVVQFNPALSPLKNQAFQNLNMIDVRKISITFQKEKFKAAIQKHPDLKDKKYLYILQNEEMWWIINLNGMKKSHTLDCNILSSTFVLYLSGEEYIKYKNTSTKQLANLILNALKEDFYMLNDEAVEEINDIDWAKEEFSLGAFSYITTNGDMSDRQELANPEYNNHLIFAGEHTVSGNMRGVAAAYQSGKVAAQQLIMVEKQLEFSQ